ncbi:MAG: hypothetical protein Q8M11_20745 [Sulfuritalea sp.]|nr:hypothetical protein [Sulfuritalea sp.]MDP1982508.1 hypothetical protein [Sulfuritalea sp.]
MIGGVALQLRIIVWCEIKSRRMNTSSDWESRQAKLLDDIANFAISHVCADEALSEHDLRALARRPLDIDLTDEGLARIFPPPKIADAPRAIPAPASSPAIATAPATSPAPKADVPNRMESTGLLAQLKRQAEERLAATTQDVALEAARMRMIDEGLRAAYRYLNDLAQQLNVLKPPFPGAYQLGTVLRLESPKWHDSQADFRRKVGPTEDLPYERVSFRYVLRGDSPIVLEKSDHVVETTRKALSDFGLTFKLDEMKNFKGFVERGRFTVQPEIKAGLLFEADYGKGEIHLRTRNVQRFGSVNYRVPAEAITEQTLEEIALLILGESSQFVQRFQRIA